MELYLPEAYAQQVIDISRSFNVDAQIVGHVEKSDKKEVRIEGEQGPVQLFLKGIEEDVRKFIARKTTTPGRPFRRRSAR